MNFTINNTKAIEFLIREKYMSEWKDIGGLNQHPEGLNFYDWMYQRELISKADYDRINEFLRKEAEAEIALNEINSNH